MRLTALFLLAVFMCCALKCSEIQSQLIEGDSMHDDVTMSQDMTTDRPQKTARLRVLACHKGYQFIEGKCRRIFKPNRGKLETTTTQNDFEKIFHL